MSRVGYTGLPGVRAAIQNVESEIYWGGDDSRITILRQDGNLVSTIVDAGNTPTSYLRKGLLLGIVLASGKYAAWNPDASDGTQNLAGILDLDVDMLEYGAAADAWCRVTVGRAPVKVSALRIEGSALDGHVDEYLARRSLHQRGFVLDDDVAGAKAGLFERNSVKATNYTVVGDDNGTRFFAITADAVFTLPAIGAGLSFEFIRASDHELSVVSAEGDNMVVGNDLSADSFTFTTASQQIGATIRVRGVYLNGTLKWLVEQGVVPYSTGALMASAIAT